MMLGLCSRNPLLQDQCQNKITVGPGSLDEFGSGSVFSVIPAQPAVQAVVMKEMRASAC